MVGRCIRRTLLVAMEWDPDPTPMQPDTWIREASVGCIRPALGQILECAYHPRRPDRKPDKLVIIGSNALDTLEADYLHTLRENFGLFIEYRAVTG